MRIIVFLLFVSMLQTFASDAYSQKVRLSLNFSNTKLVDAMDEIEELSEFYFLYNQKLIDTDRKVTLSANNKKIDKILNELFSSTDVVYTITDRKIILAPSFLSESPESVAQQKAIAGTVTDESGQPLPGVTVVIKGTTTGTVTDMDGNYSISDIPDNSTLVFSFVGMKSQEIAVGTQTSINIVMAVDAIGLEEVIAIGYGTQKKINLTGSVAVVDKEIFENRSVSTPVAALQGAIAGVTVTRSSGKPGSEGYGIQIRGMSSVNNVNALVYVDGVRGSLNELNPDDIESISVLKDAAASAIYGSNAAGGVMLVTTKKGKAGKVSVNYSGSYGITQASGMPSRLKTWEEAEYQDVAAINAGKSLRFGETKYAWMRGEQLDVIDIYGFRTGVRPSDFPGTNFVVDPNRPNVWLSYGDYDQVAIALKKTNPIQSHNLSLSGGNEKTTYYFSAGYFNRRGIIRYGPDSEEKYNLRLNLNTKFTDKISLNTSVAYINNNIYQNAIGTSRIINNAYRLWGWISPTRPDGTYHAGNGIWPSTIDMEKNGGEDTRNNYMFDGKANLKIEDLLPGLNVDITGSKRIGTNKQKWLGRTLTYTGYLTSPAYTYRPTNGVNKSSEFTDYTSLQAFASYDYSLNESHNFKLLGGYSYEDYRFEMINGSISNLVTNDFFSLGWGDPITAKVGDNIHTSATMGFFSRFNYNFKEKYLFEANFRYDGSSRLAPENRRQLFPSLSAGWVISNEDFLADNSTISQLKLRASWGQLGNGDALGYYDYIGMLSSSADIPLNNAAATRISQPMLASPEKTWETIETSNIGLDLSLLNNRLGFTGDYYIKKNKNMLANVEVSSIIGVGLPTYNLGELTTKGWEISTTWKDMVGEFHYWITANLSDNTNELTKYEGRSIVTSGENRLIEGLPINTLWGYKTDGLFQSDQEYADYGVFINSKTGQGDMKYLDLDGDKKISGGEGTMENHGDLVRLGNTSPRYLFGVNLGFEWKGFNFSSFFQGVGKRNFFPGNRFQPMLNNWTMPVAEQIDYWTPENTDAFWPRPFVNSNHSYWNSDYWVQNATYIRLKNIEIGYTLPQSITQKVSLEKVKISLTGQDVWEFSNVFSWMDPEYANNFDIVYPFFRTFQVNLNITF